MLRRSGLLIFLIVGGIGFLLVVAYTPLSSASTLPPAQNTLSFTPTIVDYLPVVFENYPPPTFTATPTGTPTPTRTPTPTPTVMPPPPGLLVYPYLGETTATSVVISWATEGSVASEVRYSLDQSYSNAVAAVSSTYDGKYWHSATLTGLTVDTTYYYKVYTGGDDVTPWVEIAFTTAPKATAGQFTFIALGDSQPWDASSPPS